MDVRLVTSSSSSNDVDVTEFLSLTSSSPTPPLMHTLQPLLPNGTITEADFGIISNDALEAMTAVDVPKPGSYGLLSTSGVTETYSTSSGQDAGFVTVQSNLGSAVEINPSAVSSVNLPNECSQYYIQCKPETTMKLGSTQDSGSNFGQVNLSAVASLPSQLPVLTSSSNPAADLFTGQSSFVLPAAQTFGNLRPAGVVDVSTPPKKPLSPYMRFSKGVRNDYVLFFSFDVAMHRNTTFELRRNSAPGRKFH